MSPVIPTAALEAGALALSKHSRGSDVIWEEDARAFAFSLEEALPHLGVAPVPADLAARAAEILAWRKTGLLSGDALRGFAERHWPGDDAALQLAEQTTAAEAFRHLQGLEPVQTLDVEAMIAACVPGGSVADPQLIADALRTWLNAPIYLPSRAKVAHG